MDNRKIGGVIKKSKKIVANFKHYAKYTKVLKLCQKQLGFTQHSMIQDEPSRWNTTCYMLQRNQEQKQAVVLIAARANVRLLVELSTEDWITTEFAVSKESSTVSEVSIKSVIGLT